MPKQQINPYSILMQEYAKRHKVSMAEAAVLVRPIWEGMSEKDRNHYKNLAAQMKKACNGERCNSSGVPISHLEKLDKEREMKRREINESIEQTIAHLDRHTTLLTKEFFLIHVNYYVEISADVYIPAEIALSKFNLKEGVVDTFHRFFKVNEDSLPPGFKHTARLFTQQSHKLPFNKEDGEDDMNRLLRDIKKFIKPEFTSKGELPPLYTMGDNINTNTSESAVKYVLRHMCENFGDDVDTFKVYPVGKLFFEIRNKCSLDDSPFVARTVADNELEKDVFNYTRGIACVYHEEEDLTPYCSLSMVQRWVFLICDHSCEDVGVKLRPGYHCPITADVEGLYKNVWGSKAGPKKERGHNNDGDSSDGESGAAKYKPRQFTIVQSKDMHELTEQTRKIGITADTRTEPMSYAGRMAAGGPGRAGSNSWSSVTSQSNAQEAPPHFDADNFPTIGSGGAIRKTQQDNRPGRQRSARGGRY